MWFSALRQKLQLLIIIFFIFIAFAASDAAWMPWVRTATLVIFLTMLLMADLLFLSEGNFKYDPDYKNWARAVDPKY